MIDFIIFSVKLSMAYMIGGLVIGLSLTIIFLLIAAIVYVFNKED